MSNFHVGPPHFAVLQVGGAWRLTRTDWVMGRPRGAGGPEPEDFTVLLPRTYPTKDAAESAAQEMNADAVRRRRLSRDRGNVDDLGQP